MRGKPRAFALLGLIGRLPRPVARGAMVALTVAGLLAGGFWRNMRGTFARVRAYQGRPASRLELWRMLAAFMEYYAGSLANLCRICAQDAPTEPPVPVDLEALAEIRRQLDHGKGVILATPHYGDLYSAIVALGATGLPVTVLMVTGDNFHWCESRRLKFVEFLGGAADCMMALRRGECVLVYADLDFVPGNRTAPFFGAPAFPPHGPARLALASGAAILPVCAPWSPERSALVCDAPIAPDGKTQEQIEEACLRAFERLIGRAPEQWMILYDLWDLDAMRKVAAGYRSRFSTA